MRREPAEVPESERAVIVSFQPQLSFLQCVASVSSCVGTRNLVWVETEAEYMTPLNVLLTLCIFLFLGGSFSLIPVQHHKSLS